MKQLIISRQAQKTPTTADGKSREALTRLGKEDFISKFFVFSKKPSIIHFLLRVFQNTYYVVKKNQTHF
jgi:hypothetical protein